MRILVLSKRQYTGKDLLDDRYGRLYEIPATLAERGHEVIGIALSYRQRSEGWYQWDDAPRLRWHSINALPLGPWRYLSKLDEIVHEFQPDLIWACSDAPHALIGWRLKNRFHLPLIIDLYDNFESFGVTRLPGMAPLLRAACRHADGLSLVSHALEEYVMTNYAVSAPRIVIGNGIREDLFFPRDRTQARSILGLPANGRLIGTAGAITAGRGISDMFKAFIHMTAQDENLWLAYAGPRDSTPTSYRHERIIDLGILPQEKVPLFFSALDVALVCNLDSPFGRYCFPQKLYEIIACGTPVVVAAVGEALSLLQTHPDSLYPAGDDITLARKIEHHLQYPSPFMMSTMSWSQWGNKLEDFFRSIHIMNGLTIDPKNGS